MRHLIISAVLALSPFAAAAHPHIFIETALRLVVDPAGNLEAIEVEWGYDELYSLLLLEELELDQDFDGSLTADEFAKLDGFDLKWIPGYEGDVYVTRGEDFLPLGKPESLGVELRNGRLISKHRRSLSGPADGVMVQAYDPTFYTAYDLAGRVSVAGDCDAEIVVADVDRAYAALEELLFARPQREVDEQFPEVGQSFADQVWLSCKP